jgi:hypothetical protein
LRAKAQLFAKALTRPRPGRFWLKRWAFCFIPEHFCFNSGKAASAADEGTSGPQASTQTLESCRLLFVPELVAVGAERSGRSMAGGRPACQTKREHGDEGVFVLWVYESK